MFEDSMFYVQEKPVFVVNPNWNELSGNGEPRFIPVPNKKAITNTEGQVLSVVSKDYVPIEDRQVLNKFLELFDQANIEVRPVKHHITMSKDGVKGRTTFMEVELPAFGMFQGTDEEQKMRVVIPNSYDGTLKLRMMIMMLRQICSNGMMAWKSEFDFSFKHRQGSLERLGEAVNLHLRGQIETVGNVVNVLGNTSGQTDRIVAYLENNVILSGERWAEKMLGAWLINNNPTNLWDLYNIFTHEITHNYGRNFAPKLIKLELLNKEVKNNWSRLLGVDDYNFQTRIATI